MDLPRFAIHHLFCDLILFWKSLISKLFPLPRILTGCWVLNIARLVCAQPGLRIACSRANMLFQAVRSMRSSGMYPRSPGWLWLVGCYAYLVSDWSRGGSAGHHCLPGSRCTHATIHLSFKWQDLLAWKGARGSVVVMSIYPATLTFQWYSLNRWAKTSNMILLLSFFFLFSSFFFRNIINTLISSQIDKQHPPHHDDTLILTEERNWQFIKRGVDSFQSEELKRGGWQSWRGRARGTLWRRSGRWRGCLTRGWGDHGWY